MAEMEFCRRRGAREQTSVSLGVGLAWTLFAAACGGEPAGPEPLPAVEVAAIMELGTLPGATASGANAVNALGDAVGWHSFAGSPAATSWPRGGGLVLFPGPSTAVDIGDDGSSVGQYRDRTAVVWDAAGRMTELDAAVGYASALNRFGVIAGARWSQAAGWNRAAVWRHGQPVLELSPLAGDSGSTAEDINARGDVVGVSYFEFDDQGAAVLWRAGAAVRLDVQGGRRSRALAINDLGIVVGEIEHGPNGTRGFIWRDGVMSELCEGRGSMADLIVPPRCASSARAVNNLGHIVGSIGKGTRSGERPVIWVDGRLIELPTLGGAWGIATDVNDSLVVVGMSWHAGGVHATKWILQLRRSG